MTHIVSLNLLEPHSARTWASRALRKSGKSSDVESGSITRTPEAKGSVWNISADLVCEPFDATSSTTFRSTATSKTAYDTDDDLRKCQPVTITWEDITVPKNNGKFTLKDLSGKVKPGEMTAIIGPSGSGKTVLLNILSGLVNKKYQGKVSVNGTERELNTFRNLSSYVPRGAHVLEYLTVKEIVCFAASLKIPMSVSKEEKQDVVQNVIVSLGLGRVQNVKSVKLSTEERVKLCLAQEIVNNPPAVFLDEPISGLDSPASLRCLLLLKSLAEEGKTIVCTTEWNSSRVLEVFDKLYLMADGECIYRGPSEKLVPFLLMQGLNCPRHHSPVDFVLEVLVGLHGNWNEKLKEAAENLPVDADNGVFSDNSLTIPARKIEATLEASSMDLMQINDPKKKRKMLLKNSVEQNIIEYPTTMWNQFKVLTNRNTFCRFRHPVTTRYRLVSCAVTGLFAGALYHGVGEDTENVPDNAGFIFFGLLFCMFNAKLPVILVFTMEKSVVARESLNNWYSTKAYFLSELIVETTYMVVLPSIYSTIAYWLSHQPSNAQCFFLYLLTMVLLSAVSQAESTIIAAFFNKQKAASVAAATSTFFIIFCGYPVSFKTMPGYLRWLSYLSYPRYILQAAVYSVQATRRKNFNDSDLFCPAPRSLPDHFEVYDSKTYLYFGMPVVFFILFKICGYYTMRFKINLNNGR